MPYGCFVEILPGKEGLLHISEIEWRRLESVEDAGIKEGDHIDVKLLEIDPKTGKYKLSRRVLLEKPEGYVERERRPRREGDRRPRREGDRPRRDDFREERGEYRPRRFEHQENAQQDEPKDFSMELDNNIDI